MGWGKAPQYLPLESRIEMDSVGKEETETMYQMRDLNHQATLWSSCQAHFNQE